MANVSKIPRFPILRLPILAINEVLITMTLFELINFSMCNPTTKYIVKSFFRKKRGYELLMGNWPTLWVGIYGSQKMTWQYQIWNKEPTDVSETHQVDIRYSEDVLGGWKSLLEFIDDLMNFETIEQLTIDLDVLPELLQPMMGCLKTWKKPISWLEMYSENQADNVFKQFLSELNITRTLQISSPFSENLQLTIPKSLNIICFDDAKWISFNQLLELDAKEIRMDETKFTQIELIAFFQSWMSSESHLNLHKFTIVIKDNSVFEAVFQEFPHEVESFSFWRNYSEMGPTIINVPFGIAITRNDGKVGRMFLETIGNQLFLVFMVF